ncbi:MAG: 4-demethylwyosine synthase TYW1 [Candidatus Nanoarchaeia archaeon]
MSKFDSETLKKYKKSGYRIVGKNLHTGVEICRWTKSVLRGGRNCYKGVWGIKSHRCLQMSPCLDFCTFACQFCWRTFRNRNKAPEKWDSPKEILDEAIKAQKELLSGWKGNPKTSKKLFEEALEPKHIAISLDGEPTLYPYLAELIKEIKSRGMTAFLVTNGTMPEKLKELLEKNAEPTNLYISVYATNSKDYSKICNPFIPDAFDRVLESLKLMKKFKEAKTIFRMTLVKDLNLKDPKGWAKLIKIAEPQYVEFKGYTWIGESRKRLKRENMPTMEDLENFANELLPLIGYKIIHRDNISRVILLKK